MPYVFLVFEESLDCSPQQYLETEWGYENIENGPYEDDSDACMSAIPFNIDAKDVKTHRGLVIMVKDFVNRHREWYCGFLVAADEECKAVYVYWLHHDVEHFTCLDNFADLMADGEVKYLPKRA